LHDVNRVELHDDYLCFLGTRVVPDGSRVDSSIDVSLGAAFSPQGACQLLLQPTGTWFYFFRNYLGARGHDDRFRISPTT
jgi:hypothetical protein